jgi:hypothetical protein
VPKEKARRVVVHDPTGFSFVSEARGWPAVFLGRYFTVLLARSSMDARSQRQSRSCCPMFQPPAFPIKPNP